TGTNSPRLSSEDHPHRHPHPTLPRVRHRAPHHQGALQRVRAPQPVRQPTRRRVHPLSTRGLAVNRVLPAWAATTSYLAVAMLIGVAIGIAIAPMPKPMVLLTCPAPLLGSVDGDLS